MIRRGKAEKRELIHRVEHSALGMKKTLDELPVPRSTVYRWCKQYLEEGLVDQGPNPHQIWNRIPQEVKQQLVELEREHPDRSARQMSGSSPIKRLFHLRIQHLSYREGV